MCACLQHSGSPPLPPVHPPTHLPLWLHLSCGAPGPACLVLPLPLHGATGLLVVLRRARRRYVSSPRLLKGGGGRRRGGSAMHSCISLSQTQPLGFLYPPAPAACVTFKVRRGFCLVLGIIPFRATRWQRAWRPFARCARVMLERRPPCSLDAISQVHAVGFGNSFLLRLHPHPGFTHGEENKRMVT